VRYSVNEDGRPIELTVDVLEHTTGAGAVYLRRHITHVISARRNEHPQLPFAVDFNAFLAGNVRERGSPFPQAVVKVSEENLSADVAVTAMSVSITSVAVVQLDFMAVPIVVVWFPFADGPQRVHPYKRSDCQNLSGPFPLLLPLALRPRSGPCARPMHIEPEVGGNCA
jgi:hypothetical protein